MTTTIVAALGKAHRCGSVFSSAALPGSSLETFLRRREACRHQIHGVDVSVARRGDTQNRLYMRGPDAIAGTLRGAMSRASERSGGLRESRSEAPHSVDNA